MVNTALLSPLDDVLIVCAVRQGEHQKIAEPEKPSIAGQKILPKDGVSIGRGYFLVDLLLLALALTLGFALVLVVAGSVSMTAAKPVRETFSVMFTGIMN